MRSRKLSLVALGLVVPLAAGCTSSQSSTSNQIADAQSTSATPMQSSVESTMPTPTPSPTELTYLDLVSMENITSADICASYSALLDEYASISSKRTERLDSASSDAYRAASLVEKSSWIYDNLSEQFDEQLNRAATEALNQVSEGKAGSLATITPYLEASMEACGYTTQFSEVSQAVAKVNADADTVIELADDVPWYPRDYYEVEDGLAYEWIDNGPDPCGYSSCRYSTMKIISRDGCPGGLYVEVNKLDSGGNVIDWTNDSVPALGAMQSAVLQFVSYDNSADSTQPVEFNCY